MHPGRGDPSATYRKGINLMYSTWKHTVAAVTILLAAVAMAASIAAPCRADSAFVGAEWQIASVTGPAVDLRGQVSIVAGAGSYLAVWRDHRSGTNYDIYGTFIDAAGNPLGDEPFLISIGAGGEPTLTSENHPSAAFNGTNFLVVWDAAPGGTSKIYGARVTPTGQVLDPNGFQISLTSYADGETLPTVASNGTDWEVVWQSWEVVGGSTLYTSIAGATVAGATGSITKRIAIATGGESRTVLTPTIASNGLAGTASRYFVAWQDRVVDSDIKGCRIDNTGTIVSSSVVIVSNKAGTPPTGATGDQFGPSVTAGKDSAGNLGGWMVAWEDAPVVDSNSPTDVRVSRITAAGAVQDTGGILVFSAYGNYYSTWNYYYATPEVGWNGQSYQVICRNVPSSKRIYGRTVGYNGVPGTTTPLSTSSSSQNGMSIAGGLGVDGGCVLAMEYSGSWNIGGVYIRQTGVGTAEQTLSLAKQDQQQCAAAWDGFRQVVVWADRRYGAQVPWIYAARVRPNGTVDDPQGVAVSPPAYEQTQPAIAWDPVNACYLVVWRQGTSLSGNYDIKGMRLNSSLAPLGSELTICSNDYDRTNPAVSWNGSNFLVVWADNRPLDGTWDIYGVRVSGIGVVATSNVYVSTLAGNQFAPSVAAGASGNWLVTWEDDQGSYPTIKSKIVPNSGSLGAEKTVSTRVATMSEPKVAYDGTNYLIVWSEYVTGAYSIRGALMNSANVRVTADPAGDIVASTGTAYRDRPFLTWTGAKYVAVWEDYRNYVTSQTDIYGTRITAAGTVEDTAGVLVSNSARTESGPIIVPVSSTQCLTYYSNLTWSINRLRARAFWTTTPPPPEYSIDNAKQLADGTAVTFAEVVVTAGNDEFSGNFYVEDRSKASGIKIVWSGSTVSESNLVTLSGTIGTVDGERQITAASVTILAHAGVVPGPLGIQPIGMGGVAAGLVPGVGTYGPNNVGLLVKSWGRVQNPGDGYFELRDPNGRVVRVKCPFTLPTSGLLYGVTGISSCEPVTGGYGSVLLVRKVGDIQSLQ